MQAVTGRLRAAVSPFLPEPHAARFARELAAFVASGMSVAGYDARVAESEAAAAVGAGLDAGPRRWQGAQADGLATELDDPSAWDRV